MTRPGLRLRESIGLLTLAAVGSKVIGAGTGVLLARELGPSDRGILALLMFVGMTGGVVASGGLDLWAAQSLAGGADPSGVRKLLDRHQALTALVLVAGVALAVLATVDPSRAGTSALLVWCTAASTLSLGLLQGRNAMGRYAAAGVIGTLVYGAAVLAFTAVGWGTVDLYVAAAAIGVSAAAILRFGTTLEGFGAPVPSYWHALRLGAPSLLGGLITHSLYRLDVALVLVWDSPAAAGAYAVALAVAELLWVIPNSAAQAVVPRSAGSGSTLDIGRVSRLMVIVMSASAVAVVVVGQWAVPAVFGEPYRDALKALPALAAASVSIGIWKLHSFHLLGQGDSRTRLRTGLCGLLVMLVADAALIPWLGLVGASLGSLLAYTAAAGACVSRTRRSAGTSWRSALVLQRGDVDGIGRPWAMIPGRCSTPVSPTMPNEDG